MRDYFAVRGRNRRDGEPRAHAPHLPQAARHGVRIAIDDFGTGYASMSQLRSLPFDTLKIDREFVSGVHELPQNQAICGALVELSRGLGLELLAEGAESPEEVRFLRARGCTLFQGFYFARLQPADDFVAILLRLKLDGRLETAEAEAGPPRVRDAG